MRRIIWGLLINSLALAGIAQAHDGEEVRLTNAAPASPISEIAQFTTSATDLMVGGQQNAIYAQVTFDGEGEASVALEIELSNVDAELKEVTLVIPGKSVRIRRALQEYTVTTKEESCQRYGDYEPEGDRPCLKTVIRPIDIHKVDRLEPKTAEISDGLQVTLPLAKSIAVGQSTKVALAYKAMGYAVDRIGLWQFTYPTPKVSNDIDNAWVRIDVADDLVLKGGVAATDYKPSLGETIAEKALNAFDPETGFSADFSQAISEPSAFVKQTRDLDPNESFEVSGVYAGSWFRLYWLQIGLVVLAGLVLTLLVMWGERRAARFGTKQ